MVNQPNQTTPRNDGFEQAAVSTRPSVKTAGEAWVRAVAESAIPERAWTISRIEASLGSIA